MHRIGQTLVFGSLLLLPMGLAAQSGGSPGERALPPSEVETSSDGGAAELFLGTFRAIRNYHLDAHGDSALWDKALEGLIRELDDPYATVFTPDEYSQFEEDNTGDYAGIGVAISLLNDRVTITSVFRGTPADRAGLQVGDRIVGVDGANARTWSTDEASRNIRGEPGTHVDVQIARPGIDDPIPFSIRRDNVHVPAVTAHTVRDSVGYLLVDRVARSSAQEVDSALAQLEGMKGLVLDLRRNPGGYLDEALRLSDLFIEPGGGLASATSRVPGGDGEVREEKWEARTRARIPDIPIVVLVDEFTASAAEILAGALQDHDRALVLGERTFGKGVVQSVMRLPADHRLRLTTGQWYTPLGRSLHRPRNQEGEPLDEDPDEIPVVTTDGGRELKAGGGIFPDLPIADDTLSSNEQEFLQAAARAQIPLGLKLAEFAFEAVEGESSEDGQLLDPEAFDAFLDALVEEGLSEDVLGPEVRDYLAWRLRADIASRRELDVRSLEIRMERDRVLARAVKLLEEAGSQGDLFAEAEAAADREDEETATRSNR